MEIINNLQKCIDLNNSMITEIINLISKEYSSYVNNSSSTSDENSKELYLMKRKREDEFFMPKINHDFIFQKDNAFSIINNSEQENIKQIKKSKNIVNEKQSEPNNNITNNFKKLLSESSNNLSQKENNKPKFIIDGKEGNIINNSSTIKNPSKKGKYFNIEKNLPLYLIISLSILIIFSLYFCDKCLLFKYIDIDQNLSYFKHIFKEKISRNPSSGLNKNKL